jgi:DNA-directed RNA polymerase specialized sigma24 family protein
MAETAAGLRAERATPDGLDFSAYVAARRKALLRTAYLLTGDYHTAEDLVQSALARASSRWRGITDVDEQLWNAIQSQAPRQRAVIVLRYPPGTTVDLAMKLSEAETAAVLGCSPGTVKSTSSRSMAKLRAYLEVNR